MAAPHSAAFLVVGLGNPGPCYRDHRHNLGYMVVERLAERWHGNHWFRASRSLTLRAECRGRSVLLAKPQTFMNRSGEAVQALLDASAVDGSHTIVVHDDLDLPFDRVRIRLGGGHGGHNGIRSIIGALGGGDFIRLKIGIGRPEPLAAVVDHVLSPFDPGEEAVLSGLLECAADAVESVIVEGPERAMNRFHT